MKKVFIIIYTYLVDCVYLVCSHHKFSYKFKIGLLYTFYTLMLPFFELFKVRQISFLGYKVNGFNFRFLQFSFGEIFVKNEYYFQTEKRKPVIIDCGANDGMELFFFKYLYPKSIIHAFEPDPITFKLLEKNIKQNNLKDVYLYNQAVGEKTGKVSFFVDSKLPGNLMMSLIKDRMPNEEIKVPMISLKEFLKGKKIDLLKMDIEGYEYPVFTDLFKNRALKGINEIIVECHHHISLTSDSGFVQLLAGLTAEGFDYQLNTSVIPVYSKNKFQDILVFAYRN